MASERTTFRGYKGSSAKSMGIEALLSGGVFGGFGDEEPEPPSGDAEAEEAVNELLSPRTRARASKSGWSARAASAGSGRRAAARDIDDLLSSATFGGGASEGASSLSPASSGSFGPEPRGGDTAGPRTSTGSGSSSTAASSFGGWEVNGSSESSGASSPALASLPNPPAADVAANSGGVFSPPGRATLQPRPPAAPRSERAASKPAGAVRWRRTVRPSEENSSSARASSS